MDLISLVWDNVVPFLFVLSVLVFVHELGHYWVARRAGVRIEVFSIGFGPEIYGRTDKAGTRWKFSAVPLGGYVKMFGESDAPGDEEGAQARRLTDEEKKVSFAHKRVSQRAAVVAAGPLANFLFAIVLFVVMFSIVGSPRLLPMVGEVQPESAAEQAGFLPGDRILSIDGHEIEWFSDLRAEIAGKPGVTLDVVVLRDGREEALRATPTVHTEDMGDGTVQRIGQLGVVADTSQVEHVRENPGTAVLKSVDITIGMSAQILDYLGQIIVGKRSAEEVGGPLRIAQMSAEVAQGGFVNLMNFMAVLSINLGLLNLFPIPMLDGGHLVFYIAEAIRGRPLTPRIQEYGFRFGMILVFLLMIFATWNDLVYHFKVFEFLKGLIT